MCCSCCFYLFSFTQQIRALCLSSFRKMLSYQKQFFMWGRKSLSGVERAFNLEGSLSLHVILMRRGPQLQLNVKVSMVFVVVYLLSFLILNSAVFSKKRRRKIVFFLSPSSELWNHLSCSITGTQ